MSLGKRVRRHPWLWTISVLGLAAGLAACGAGGLADQKVASGGGYAPSSPGARAAETYEAPSHAAMASRCEPMGEPLAEPAIDQRSAIAGGGAPDGLAGGAGGLPRGIDRPGLGTSWGEAVAAPITFSPFVRSGPSPWAEVVLHYNDAEGVTAHAQYLGTRPAPLEIYAGDGALSVALVDEAGRTLPGFTAGGRTLIMGEDGARYRIVVRNATSARFEIVASVDGLDVIDGKPADPNRRGYLVDPHGILTIDGFRTSDDVVAAFRFGRVADSYAAQTDQAFGDRNVGVIGMAIFAERGMVWTPAELGRRESADPFPQRGYAMPPR